MGRSPRQFAVEIHPQELGAVSRIGDDAVANATRDHGHRARRRVGIAGFRHVERLAAKLDAHFLAAQRTVEGELLADNVVDLDLEMLAAHHGLGLAAGAGDLLEEIEGAQLGDAALGLARAGRSGWHEIGIIALENGEIGRLVIPADHALDDAIFRCAHPVGGNCPVRSVDAPDRECRLRNLVVYRHEGREGRIDEREPAQAVGAAA